MNIEDYKSEAIELLEQLIATPSVSRSEDKAANLLAERMQRYGMEVRREGNNVWTMSPHYDPTLPTLMLNAHIDTVKAVDSWQREPFKPTLEGDRLYGLGSNDCGGGLVTLLQVFRLLSSKKQPYNLLFLASAEEEVSGINGIRRVLPLLPKVDAAIVGEPTGMQPAIAERGLMVIDMTAHGKSGHAARGEGINAIYEAMDDMEWLRGYRYQKVSPLLGPTIMNVTMINAGTQHNVIPDECHMVVDVRTNEYYENEQVLEFIRKHVKSEVKARSTHLHSSRISTDNPMVKRCVSMGLQPFGSPTLSDQALMRWPSLKLGPGDSSRSHTADEYICLSEMSRAFDIYLNLLDGEKII